MRVFSFGGGVQSTAVLVLAAQGRVFYDAFLFSNVGEDSEHPATLAYVRDVATPYAAGHGIDLQVVRKRLRSGSETTLLEYLRKASRRIPLPVHMANGAPGRRDCTGEFKIRVIARWLREHGATPANPATVGLGISTDEMQRARTDSGIPYERLEYPLLDLRLSRQDCQRLIAAEGLPIPPKSACWFCPFQRLADWRRLKHDHPALFADAVVLERELIDRRTMLGKDAVYLSGQSRPLDLAVIGHQFTLDDALDTCESGYCMT